MKAALFFLIVLIFCSSALLSQTNLIDSLKSELNGAEEDSGKVILLNSLSRNLLNCNPDEALKYAERAEALSVEINYVEGHIDAILHRSGVEQTRGNFDNSIDLVNEGLQLSEKYGLRRKTAEAKSDLGIIHFVVGNYAVAIENFLNALEIAEQMEDDILISQLITNIGSVYYKTGDKERALYYFNKSLPVYERLNKISELAVIKLNIGAIYRDEKKFDDAKELFNQSLDLAHQTGDSLRVSFALNNLSGLYYDLEDYETSLKYLLKSYHIKNRLGSKADIAHSLGNIGSLYAEIGDLEKALDYSQKSLDLAEELNASSIILSSYEILSEIYSVKKDSANAYKYLLLYNSLKDSLDEQNNAKIIEAQNGYETKRILTENEKLLLENEYRDDIIFYQRIIVAVSIALIILVSVFAVTFRRQKNKLDRLNTLKDKFFSIVAHDLRNPINSIQNISEALTADYDELDEKDKSELTGILQKSSRMLTELISNLFTWSTFQQGMMSYNPEKFNITSTLKETAEILKHSAADKKIELKNLDSPDLYVFADKQMTDSIIINLISNAIKFSNSNSLVTLSVKENDSQAVILIEDNGIGIPDNIKESLFKFDSSVSSRGTEGEKGTGLGLLICKEFVEMNKGKIWFESEVDAGSKFYVSLPLA
jgi:signal transduction histidine kinase/Flp pilus assembly protein TadD